MFGDKIKRLIKNFKKEVSTIKTKEEKAKTTSLKVLKELKIRDIVIPSDIANLLWIADGENANYNYINEDENILDVGIVKIKIICGFTDDEPSLIFTTLPISIPIKNKLIDKIGYYPSYSKLSPEQRYLYLSWLKNPFEKTEIDIGYIFIFYYGLERYLYLKQSNIAFKYIFKLLTLYKDNYSFAHYSYKSLLYYSIATKDFYKIKTLLGFEMKDICSDLVLYAKYIGNIPLYPNEIIDLANFAGFKNKRYINLQKELFEITLNEIMLEELKESELYLNKYSYNLKETEFSPVANMSLNNRTIKILSFNSSNELKEDILNLLIKTHEKLKIKLKELRKNKNITKES